MQCWHQVARGPALGSPWQHPHLPTVHWMPPLPLAQMVQGWPGRLHVPVTYLTKGSFLAADKAHFSSEQQANIGQLKAESHSQTDKLFLATIPIAMLPVFSPFPWFTNVCSLKTAIKQWHSYTNYSVIDTAYHFRGSTSCTMLKTTVKLTEAQTPLSIFDCGTLDQQESVN